jgi:pyrroloquinoline-quinone synthase
MIHRFRMIFWAYMKTLTLSNSILDHPWYRAWETGELPAEAVTHYAGQYFHQVAAFPRYLGRLHSQLTDGAARRVILGNLLEEEGGLDGGKDGSHRPHPELWLDFAEGLGRDRRQTANAPAEAPACELVERFFGLVDQGAPQALGALLAYEAQVPQVAKFKKDALARHYLADLAPAARAAALKFFEVHEQADVWHTEELDALVAQLSEEQRKLAQQSSDEACQALWDFLSQMPGMPRQAIVA